LVYLAQFCSGFGVGFITTTFEEWVLSESERIFGNLKEEAERFRTNLFVKSNIYDAAVSTITCILCAFIYYYRGIYAPFWISIILSFLAIVYISIFWKENKLQVPKNESTWTQLDEAFKELKKVDVLCIGLIEGLAWASLNIYLFSWTPILKQSTPGEMNVGFIFTTMVISMILGTKSYKLIIVYLKLDYYLSITGCLFFVATSGKSNSGFYYLQHAGICINIAKTGTPTYYTDGSRMFVFKITGRYNGVRILSSMVNDTYAYYSETNPLA
jgi:MFS family permease